MRVVRAAGDESRKLGRRQAGAAGAKMMVGRGRLGMGTLAPLKKESSRALNYYIR